MKLKFFFHLLLSLYIVNSTLYITHATVRFVSKSGTSTPPYTSWQNAADSIQKCINICSFGDTVYVANGIYKEQIVMIPGLSLIGSGIDSCIIDTRELAQPTSFYSVTFLDSCLVKRFSIIVSYSNIGFGISISGSISQPINGLIEWNKITNAYAGITMDNSNVIIKSNFFSNVSRGVSLGAAYPNYYPVVDSNYIYASQNGVVISVGTKPIIRNNTFYLDDPFASAYSGGGSDTAKIYNNVAIVNQAQVVFAFSVVPTIAYNNVAIGNYSLGINSGNLRKTENNLTLGGYIGVKQSSIGGTIKHNNSWNNQFNYENFTPDSTNLSLDPMLVNSNMDSLDFHLQMYSPLIDAGDPNILDKDGSRSDIGLFGGPYGEKYTYRDLAPKPPRNLTASVDSGLVKLKWNKNTESDFNVYRVYRDTVPDFIYDTTKVVAILSDTIYFDDPPQKFISGNYYYKITALDDMQNQSAPSEEVHINITGIPEAPPLVVDHYKLLNNYPNPFNSSTIIPYRLKEGGYVKLYIYDLKGELVCLLVNEYQSSGYYEVKFSPTERERKQIELSKSWWTGYNDDMASGIYIYQLMIKGEGNIPVFTGMKKMMLVK